MEVFAVAQQIDHFLQAGGADGWGFGGLQAPNKGVAVAFAEGIEESKCFRMFLEGGEEVGGRLRSRLGFVGGIPAAVGFGRFDFGQA